MGKMAEIVTGPLKKNFFEKYDKNQLNILVQ